MSAALNLPQYPQHPGISGITPEAQAPPIPMQQQKILFLSVSAGAGHMRAAEALRLTAEADFPGVQTLHLDVMEYVPATFRKLYTDFYIKLVNSYPALWGMLYQHAPLA